MKNYRAQTPKNLVLIKILQKFRKTSTPLDLSVRLNKILSYMGLSFVPTYESPILRTFCIKPYSTSAKAEKFIYLLIPSRGKWSLYIS